MKLGQTNIEVGLKFDEKIIEVGELVLHEGQIFFKYYSKFLGAGLNVSPIKLPLTDETFNASNEPFDGLFGLFADSLPDGWGKLLVDRQFASLGIPLFDITQLDRLSVIGDSGMGALVYYPKNNFDISEHGEMDLDAISTQVDAVLEGSSEEIVEVLLDLGGSSGGARPKIFVGYHPEKEHLIHGLSELPEGYEHWIIKFASSTDPRDIAEIEYAYHLMAISAGLEMSECKLFSGKSGRKYFGTKRFDREGNKRLHLHSAAGIMHDNFRRSNLDYGNLMDCAFRLVGSAEVYEKVLRLAAFNVYAHNRDDHGKNFSFLMDQHGVWTFAPAYDLTFSNSAHGLHSTMIAGESKSPGKEHLMELAEVFLLKNFDDVIEQVQEAVGRWQEFVKEAGVSKQSTAIIQKVLDRINI